jgi:hypothetical protein
MFMYDIDSIQTREIKPAASRSSSVAFGRPNAAAAGKK